MTYRFQFDPSVLQSVVGGHSAVDMPALNIQTFKEADAFLRGYGYNAENHEDLEKLWYFHRRAMVLIQEKLKFEPHEIPEILRERKLLEDPRKLLLIASSSDPAEKDLQRWACAILRCMHVFVHAENDLFSSFSEEIQKQILSPFQNCIYHDGTSGTTYLRAADETKSESTPIALLGFEIKPFKTSSSTVIKLLAKPDALAMSVFDKLGVRFVTNSMFDTFRVIRFLVEENLISFPHIMPDQSSNNLYPVNVFLQACLELEARQPVPRTTAEVDEFFAGYLYKNKEQGDFFRKQNQFSGADYRFIKFIARKLIRVEMPEQKSAFSFFYPYEVQIMDKEAHVNVLSGPSEHQAYKERQREGARRRLFPEPS